MDKVSSRLDILSPAVLAIAGIIAVLVVVFTPRTKRLYVAIATMIAWSMVGQMPELPGQGIAKTTLAGAFLLVGFAALIHPGPRLRLTQSVILWPILGFAAISFVLYVDELTIALVLRAQWIILIFTAMMVCRTVIDRESADRLARAIGVGLMIGVAIAGSSLLTQGTKAFHLGRVNPYGANPNQVGIIFAAALPFALYCAVRAQHRWSRWMSAGMAAMAAGLVVMTASRSSVAIAGICVLPYLFIGMRRAALILSAAAIGAIVIIPFTYTPDKPKPDEDQAGLVRLSSLETARYEIFARYLDESVSKRPIFGLLGSEEKSVLKDDEIGKHPHNAYLEMMYLGGLLYTLPMLVLTVLTIVSAVRVMRRRKQLPFDPLLLSIIGAFLVAVYVHGFVGVNGYYPTSAWPFLHVLLSCFMLTIGARLRATVRSNETPQRRGGRVVAVAASVLLLTATACSGGNDKKETASGDPGAGKPVTGGPPGQTVAGGETDPGGGPDDGDVEIGEDGRREIDDVRHLEIDTTAATPGVLCSVKLDTATDGPEVRRSAKALRVPMLMMAYNWIVDVGKDGQFDAEDQKRFARWIDINIPPNSNQLVAIDYEKPYWKDLRNYRDLPPERLTEIISVYKQIYDFAKKRRPKARWGFFGIPMRNYNAGEPWKQRIRDLGPLLSHVDVVYLSIYDQRKGDRGGRDLEALRTYVELTLAEAKGRPVYAFARGRYAGRELRDEPIPEDEFRAHIGAVLDARWQGGGKEQALAGVILWDGRRDKRATPASWSDLDKLYARQLKTITDVVRVKRPNSPGGK